MADSPPGPEVIGAQQAFDAPSAPPRDCTCGCGNPPPPCTTHVMSALDVPSGLPGNPCASSYGLMAEDQGPVCMATHEEYVVKGTNDCPIQVYAEGGEGQQLSDEALAMQLQAEEMQRHRGVRRSRRDSSPRDGNDSVVTATQVAPELVDMGGDQEPRQARRSMSSPRGGGGRPPAAGAAQREQATTDAIFAEQLQRQEIEAARRGRMQRARAAMTSPYDHVWGEIEFHPVSQNDDKRVRKQACAAMLYACCPCAVVTCRCFNSEVKSGASTRDALRGWRRTLLNFSMLLGIAQVAFFVTPLSYHGVDTEVEYYDKMGAKNAARILYQDEWWRLVSPVLLHGSWFHLLGNLFIQLRTCLVLEVIWGHATWLVIYLVTGAYGSLLSCLFFPDSLSVGSSGALCGIVGAWPAFIIITWNQTLPNDRPKRDRLLFLVVCAVIILACFSFTPNVDWAAHFGGLVSGALLSMVIFANRLQSRRVMLATAATGFVLLSALVGGSTWWLLNKVEPAEKLLTIGHTAR